MAKKIPRNFLGGNAHMVGIDHICPVCGKVFIPAPEHIYKIGKFKDKLVCSYGCRCKWEKENAPKKENNLWWMKQ
jgi:C4-type Zn-finger protein